MEDHDNQESIFGTAVKAGKRTYFIDVRATRNNDHYLTITESKKRFNEDGSVSYQKHKLFLYKEDFKKFSDALALSFNKVIELNQGQGLKSEDMPSSNPFSDINFDDLGVTERVQKPKTD